MRHPFKKKKKTELKNNASSVFFFLIILTAHFTASLVAVPLSTAQDINTRTIITILASNKRSRTADGALDRSQQGHVLSGGGGQTSPDRGLAWSGSERKKEPQSQRALLTVSSRCVATKREGERERAACLTDQRSFTKTVHNMTCICGCGCFLARTHII